MNILVLKLILAPIIIGSASLAGRKWGPAVSGWIVGMPLTSGPVIFGEAGSNAAAFSSTNRNVSSRLRTTNAVNWSPAFWPTVGAMGTDQQTPNLAPIVQEIVNQTNWASGNSLVMIITGTGKRVAEAYEGDPAGAPLLHIEYTEIPPTP